MSKATTALRKLKLGQIGTWLEVVRNVHAQNRDQPKSAVMVATIADSNHTLVITR